MGENPRNHRKIRPPLPTDRDKAIRKSIELFIEVFNTELRDTTPLQSSLPGYLDALTQWIEGKAAHEIAAHMHPDKRSIDPAPFRRMWEGMALDPLPEDFDWPHLVGQFERAIRRHLKEDPILREALNTALLERAAGPDPGFDLPGYRRYLQTKCGQLQLGAIHTKAYERRIALWSVLILCHYGANHFGVHRTFLEYFCATWFYDQELTIEQLKDLYGAHWQDEKWHEVLRLLAGMHKPDKAEAVIRFLMEQDGQEHKYENMMLAAGCLSEVRKRHEIQETDAALLRMFKTKVDDWTMNSLFPQFGTMKSNSS